MEEWSSTATTTSTRATGEKGGIIAAIKVAAG
jgi:hypothetical protein